MLFVAGFIAISSMLLPGVSGSFVLLILGLYEYVYTHLLKNSLKLEVSQQELLHLLVFVAGLGLGFLIFVRLLKVLLEDYRSQLMALLLGVMTASLSVLWPFMDLAREAADVSQLPKLMPWEVQGQEMLLIFFIGVVAIGFGWGLRWISQRAESSELH